MKHIWSRTGEKETPDGIPDDISASQDKDRPVFRSQLRALVIPIAFQEFMLSLVSVSDALMLGALSQNAMSAVSLGGQIQFIFSLFLAAMTIGESTLTAQYWGKGDRKAVENILGIVMKGAIPVGILFTAAAALFPEYLMRIFTSEEVLARIGAEYLRVVSPSYLLCGISEIYLCVMKNCGRTKVSSLIRSFGVVLNIALNAVLIFGLFGLPALGVSGAALATVITRAFELILCLVEERVPQHIHLRKDAMLHEDAVLRRDFWQITRPVLGNEAVWGLGSAMASVTMGHLGTDAAAAYSVAAIAKNLLSCLCIGLASGGGILVGGVLGAGDLEKGKEYGRRLVRVSVTAGILTAALTAALDLPISNAVNLTDTARSDLRIMLLVLAGNLIGQSFNMMTISGIFCAGGDTKFGFLCDAVTLWCVIVPAELITAFLLDWPVPAVYAVICMDEIVKIPVVIRHYRKYRWVRNLTKDRS